MYVVPFAADGFRRAVAVGEEDSGVIGDVGAGDEGDGAEDPAHVFHTVKLGKMYYSKFESHEL